MTWSGVNNSTFGASKWKLRGGALTKGLEPRLATSLPLIASRNLLRS